MARGSYGRVHIFHFWWLFIFSQNRQAWWRLKELPDWIDAQMNERGLTATAAIAELDAMKKTASSGSKPLGTNALKNLIKKLRVNAAKAAALTNASSAVRFSFLST